jgi:leucine dehydrogenase
MGIKACAHFRYGSDSLEGKRIAVQGVGHVGYYLCKDLAEEGAKLTVSDIDKDRAARAVEEFGAEVVEGDAIYGVKADIFAPCALGAIANDDTIPRFKFDILAGAANNVLAHSQHGELLEKKGILYAPDYVINAGGLINVYGEMHDWSSDRSMRKAGDIYNTLLRIFERAKSEGIPTSAAADKVAETRIMEARQLQRTFV